MNRMVFLFRSGTYVRHVMTPYLQQRADVQQQIPTESQPSPSSDETSCNQLGALRPYL
jgi:hypothetical protein